MKKKLIALAVAGAFAPALAMADGSNVTIYGTINSAFENVKAESAAGAGANLRSRSRVSTDSSNIGFKGTEDLGGGLKAWFQCETSATTDGAGTSGICNRNSGVGLKGEFGNVFLGNWETPYKLATSVLDPSGKTHIVDYSAVFHSPGLNTASATGGNGVLSAAGATSALSFDRRQNNVVYYESPDMMGFQAKLAYGANEEKTSTTAAPTADPKMWSGSLTYNNGPAYVAVAYERHDDYWVTGAGDLFGVSVVGVTDTKDRGWEIGGGYWITSELRLVAAFENLEYEGKFTGIGTGRIDRDAWMLGGLYKSGPWSLGVNYVKAKEFDLNGTLGGGSLNNTDARLWTLRGGYSLSKRTELFAHYANLKNESNNNYNFGTNAIAGGVAAGADPKGFGVGIKHTF